MRLPQIVTHLFAAFALLLLPIIHAQQTFINNTGLSTEVGWDPYSFFINGKRIFLQSGEIHTFRLPVVDLWKDVVQKAKAAGLNSISIYWAWHLINPKSGVIDLEGINALQPFFDAAKEAGIWVIARPGPYINAETTGGGIPGHVMTIPGDTPWNLYNGVLRSNQTNYHDSWQDYWGAIIPIIAKNQISNGGPVIMLQIENEFYNGPGQNEYVDQLRQAAIAMGIVVPTMVNDSGMFKNLINQANIYGIDAYPVGFTCFTPDTWRAIPTTWRQFHKDATPNIPFMFPEFQAGSYDKWASVNGYAACRQLTNPNFQRVHNFHLWANGVTAVNYYMFFGGTNWAQLPYPDTYTSYEYGAAVSETRELTEKFSELKLQSYFLRSFPDLRMTDWIGEDNTTIAGVTTTHLQNPQTGTSFYITRHLNTSSRDVLPISLTVGQAQTKVPQLAGTITLPGRDSIITVTDMKFGTSSQLVYSTAMLMSSFDFNGQDALIIYGTNDLTYEIALKVPIQPEVTSNGPTKITTNYSEQTFTLNFVVSPGITTIKISNTVLFIADYATAAVLWMPTIAGGGTFENFYDAGASTPVLVSGPYLVRTASLSGTELSLTGDLNSTTTITVFGPPQIQKITWNGTPISALTTTDTGGLQGTLGGPEVNIEQLLPDLSQAQWKYRDSLPEITSDFDESEMIHANHTTTTNVFPPFYGGPWILYASDYGFHAGNLVWRGTFETSASIPAPTRVNVSISGGQSFVAGVWLNDRFLGMSYTGKPTNNESFPVLGDMIREGDNFVTVLQDHMGHNLAGMLVCCTPGGRQRDLQQPKGLQGYYLEGRSSDQQFTKWTLAGNFGGEDAPDKSRKILNEGGLYAERMGWHLPGFDTSSWEVRSPFEGLDKPGVGFFTTTFTLDLPKGYDIPLSFVFSPVVGHYRAQLYVNGWQLGKRVADLGPQTSFVAHEGILNYNGENVVGISLWALGTDPADLKIPSFVLASVGVNGAAGVVYEGGVGVVGLDNPDWEAVRG